MNKITVRSRQCGAATITILLLVGVSISIAVLGSLHYIQGSQNQTLTMHAQTLAQRKAWVGVDLTKKYLNALNSSQLEELIDSLPLKAEVGQTQLTLKPSVSDPNIHLSLFKEEVDDKTYLYAEVNAEAAKGTKAYSNSSIEAVFELQHTGTKSPIKSCSMVRTAVLRGATDLTGGGTDFLSGDALSDIAVEGNLTLTNSSKSGISGCVSGDVYMNGGGIKRNANLYVGGRFTVENMAAPEHVGVWARDIDIGNSGQGVYEYLRAGAFSAEVRDDTGNLIGTAGIGGKLLNDAEAAGSSKDLGVLLPSKNLKFVVETTSGGRLLVDLSDANIENSTGFVSGFASEVLDGDDSLPSVIQFVATGVLGGNIDIYTLTVGELWGQKIVSDGYGANYTSVFSNGDFSVGTGNIGSLIGGGNLRANKGGCSSDSNCWNLPKILNPSQIAGELSVGDYQGNATLNNLTQKMSGINSSLPGVPYCDTRVAKVVADDYKASANYIFEEVDGKRHLTIQNVSLADGTSLDGVYDLLADELRFFGSQPFLSCGWGSGHCFRNNEIWELNGISSFPPGIAWFDRSLKINGVGSNDAVNNVGKNLLNTFVTTGDLELTTSGHGKLIAPNFNPSELCSGGIVPTNLCTPDGKLVGDEETGLALANSSIISQGGLNVQGWVIDGHVILGRAVTTSGSKVVINGGLVVGSNATASVSVGAGGLEVNTQGLSEGQLQKDCSTHAGGSTESEWQLKNNTPIWTRYL